MPKKIFVIMPFVKANGRDEAQLTKFFTDYIKFPIENDAELKDEYLVHRSGNSLLILDTIVTDLATADMVVCDLSGPAANPNVMFELGVRLSVSDRPLILIRESAPTNERIFDVGGLYAHPYSISDTRELERFLLTKIKNYNNRTELYESPILKLLNYQAAFWMQLPIRKASAFLGAISSAAEAQLRAIKSALTIYLARKQKPISADSSDLIYKEFSRLAGEGSDLSDFGYQVASIPALDSYLSSVYLLGLVDDDIEKRFREYCMAYSLHFNRNNSFLFSNSKAEEYAAYAFESLILMNSCRLLIRILAMLSGSPERTLLVREFFDMTNKSTIVEAGNG